MDIAQGVVHRLVAIAAVLDHQQSAHPAGSLLAVENLLRQYRLVNENQHLVASLSAKNQALLEMNRELEAKIHERTHELAEANARLAQLAVTDGLTGLYNHRYFQDKLEHEVARAERFGHPV